LFEYEKKYFERSYEKASELFFFLQSLFCRNFCPTKGRNKPITYELVHARLNVKIAAKPPQSKTWLLLRAYKKSMVVSPTPYDLPFSHNTSVTDDDRRRRSTTVPKTPTACGSVSILSVKDKRTAV